MNLARRLLNAAESTRETGLDEEKEEMGEAVEDIEENKPIEQIEQVSVDNEKMEEDSEIYHSPKKGRKEEEIKKKKKKKKKNHKLCLMDCR